MPEKLKSRKFWVSLVAMVLVAVAGAFDLDLEPEQLTVIVGGIASIASAYMLGQGYADGKQGEQALALAAEIADVARQVRDQKSEDA